MLPREVIEELLSGYAPTGFQVLVTLADGIDSLLEVLALPFKIVSERVMQSRALDDAVQTALRRADHGSSTRNRLRCDTVRV